MEAWYLAKNWDNEQHQSFYHHYRKAEPELQEKALLEQAALLAKHLDHNTLKAAESLLILWMSRHFNPQNAPTVYQLMQDICSRIGDHHRAQEFKLKLEKI